MGLNWIDWDCISCHCNELLCIALLFFHLCSLSHQEDEPEPWADHTTRARHKADDLLAANGITSRIARQSQIYWRQARTIANWNPAKQKGYRKQGRREDDLKIHLQPDRERQQRSHERLDLVRQGGRQLEMGCYGQ